MKRNLFLISVPLVFCAFICLIYRSQATNLNHLLDTVLGFDISGFKDEVRSAFPLNNMVIYNLPEALWIFSLTLLSKGLHLHVFGKKLHFLFIPLFYIFIAEYFQYFQITDGTFDVMDMIVSTVFWCVAIAILYFQPIRDFSKRELLPRLGVYFMVLFSVYLADQSILN